jgi:spermidine synthase/MFS family permease
LAARSFRVEIFLISLAAVLLEISYTRIFSYKLYHYFVFLTIGIALLGLGSGGVFVAVSSRLRALAPERLIPLCCLGASLAVPLGYLIIAPTQLNVVDIEKSAIEVLTLAWICSLLFVPFLLVGVALAKIFGARPAEIDRLYFADLLGAGAGCAAAVPLFASVSPPGAIFLSAAILALAAFGKAAHACRGRAWPALALAGVLLVAVPFSGRLPDPVVDREKWNSPQRLGPKLLFTRWSSVFRVDVTQSFRPEMELYIAHDGNLGSNILRFDGDLSGMNRFLKDVRSSPFSVLAAEPKVLIIGSAGGHEILASLYFGASHVTAVELNPVTVSLLTDHYADYSGRIAEHPRVTLVNGEGRSFIKRDPGRYDLIWFVAPDSYASMNAASSGAYVLSESYLYTQEMIREAFGHLEPGGVLCLQTGDIGFATKPNRSARYLSTAREALHSLGIDAFERHVLVSSTPEFLNMVTILLRNEPFTQEQVAAFRANAKKVQPIGKETTVWHPREPGAAITHPVQRVISLPPAQLARWRRTYPYDISPVSDDAPFFWHFTGFRDAVFDPPDRHDQIYDPEDAKGERVLVLLLLFVTLFAAAFLLLPLVTIRDVWHRMPHKRQALAYFAALGLGFMFFEISMIQKLTLFLGYPAYSLTITLFALLVFSGIGSLLSGRYAEHRNRALLTLLAGLVALTLFYQFGIGWLVDLFIGAPLALRALLALACLAPLGLCLGAFMPLGLASVAALTPHREQYVAWAWAVNGFFSVVSSVLATMLSMTFGFRWVLFLALVIYGVGVAALTRIPALRLAR